MSLPMDPVLPDLFPTYRLALVVDDHEMGITHIVSGRGELYSIAEPIRPLMRCRDGYPLSL